MLYISLKIIIFLIFIRAPFAQIYQGIMVCLLTLDPKISVFLIDYHAFLTMRMLMVTSRQYSLSLCSNDTPC